MTGLDAVSMDNRVLLLAPTRKDARTTSALLERDGIPVTCCSTFDEAVRELAHGAALLIQPEESITHAHNIRLAEMLRDQPPWSDLPILVLARTGAASVATTEAVRTLGNVTVLERPLRVPTLMSAVRTALRARQRQYQIREHLAERVRAEDSLRVADQRKDEFLATLGHELRNPLAPLLSGMQLLRLTGPHNPRVLQIVGVMERQVTHLVRLVDDLLEVSRITRGLIEVRRDVLDLVSVVRSALENSRAVLDGAGHHVSVDLPEHPIAIVGDGVRLTQVFTNLLTNAAKYTNPGGRICLCTTDNGDRAVVSVRDNGIGIPEAHLASIFDMFMQVDRSDRRAQGGLGIGLTLVRTLVEMHGGRVEARSQGIGQGSEFVVELPIVGKAAFELSDSSMSLRRFPDRRILIVDDNGDVAETLAALLEVLGATVSVARSGRAALDCLERFKPDAVLLDIGMPEMDGYEVARRIRSMPHHSNTLLIALTGWGQDRDYGESRAAGFDHHMVKPPDIEKLRELLATAKA